MTPTERLTAARFAALAEAYGGDVSRWPQDERDAAALTLAEAPASAARILAAAADLDATLDAWRPTAVRHEVREAILAAAPRQRRGVAPFAWLMRAGLGAGLAAACAAGVAVGAQLTTLSQPPSGTDSVAAALSGYEPTAFDATSTEAVG